MSKAVKFVIAIVRSPDSPLPIYVQDSERIEMSFVRIEVEQVLEEEANELQQAFTNKQEQEHTMLQVLMRVEKEQRITEDARISAEQNVAAQKSTANVLQKYEDTTDSIVQMEERLIIAQSTSEATLLYQTGSVKEHQFPREPLSKEVQLIRGENENFNMKAETMTVEEVKRQRSKATTNEKIAVPIELCEIVGRSFTFKLKLTNYNLASGNENFTVLSICREENGNNFRHNEIASKNSSIGYFYEK
ncbi:hypothetical protein Syun_016785 [Stephania yunnanensis]|uniref:Uncharacterized protein n=1 Tax=Stephania yunnanensis TaxID=152371 RepID=A0AAP0P2H0_9MAGN